MSIDFVHVLADLVAKRDALNAAIAALEHVTSLSSPVPTPVTAEKTVRPSVRPSVRTRTVPPSAKAATPRRATNKADEIPPIGRAAVLLAIVAKGGGMKLSTIAAAYAKQATADRVAPSALSKFLSAMVHEGQLARFGAKSAARYWPAGTSAKEAV